MCNSVKKQYNNPERTIDFTNNSCAQDLYYLFDIKPKLRIY